MGKITKIETQKKNANRVSIYIDGEFKFGVYKNVFITLGIATGDEIDENQMAEMIAEDEYKRGINAALSYISYQQRTEKEVRDKLAKDQLDSKLVKRIIDAIKGYGYINDYVYAKDYISFKIEHSGTNKIKSKLKEKGISDEVLNELLSAYSESYMESKALAVAEKKNESFGERLEYSKRYSRLTGFLTRRGYPYGIVKSVVASVLEPYKRERYSRENYSRRPTDEYGQCSEEELYEAVLAVAKKKNRTYDADLDHRKRYEKLSRFLVGKGYSYEVVKKVVKEIID